MKALFEDETRNTCIIIGVEDSEIEFTNLDNYGGIDYRVVSRTNISLDQAYELSAVLSKMIFEIEDGHRKKLSFWKRLFK